jgi:hypothetical protein
VDKGHLNDVANDHNEVLKLLRTIILPAATQELEKKFRPNV